MRSRRAFLYVPGSDLHKIEKAAALGADCVVLDLEDGVAEGNKTAARQTIAAALHEVDFGISEKVVRVNGYLSGRSEEDLAAVLPAHPDGILLPKVDGVDQIRRIDSSIRHIEQASGWPEDSIALLVIVESALGMVNLETICCQSETTPRLQALVFGAEDFVTDMGATRTPAALELLYARSRLVMYASAFGLQAIDLVTVNYKEGEVLEREATQGAQLGYSGKQVIHPAQIVPVQQIFTPSEKDIAAAEHILEEAKHFAEEGKGAFTLGNQMVDRPVIKRTESILERAHAAQKK
jgi:citrate lyase subunit beta-like protein